MNREEPSAAAERVRTAGEISPTETARAAVQPSVAELLETGLAHHRAGSLEEAFALYKRVLATVPGHADALYFLGLIAYQLNQPEMAIELIGKAIQQNGNISYYHTTCGLALQSLRRFDEALESYNRALAIEPGNADALNNCGLLLYELQRFDDALECYDRALAASPDFAKALNNRGNTLQTLGRLDEALESYDRALAIEPNLTETLHNRAEALRSLRLNRLRIRQSNRKFNIAFIFMPISGLRPPLSLTSLPISVDLVMEELARRLALSHNVIAYCARGEGQQKVEQCSGVEYRRVSKLADRRSLNSSLWYLQFIEEVVADASLRDCDIVHIMNLSEFVPLVRARLPKTRIVLHMECQWLEQLDAAVIERRINAADLVLGCSNFIAAGVRRRFPSLAQRCSYIYNGADIALFARPPGIQPKPKWLLFVGRLAPEKGVHILLDAFRIVLTQHPDAHLELIGPETVLSREVLLPVCDDPHVLEIESYFLPGEYPELLHAKVSELPSGSISFFNKGMKFIELVPHYHSASIFAFPSVWNEPFGMPLVEAMAAGTPVVATRGGAFPEIVEDGRSGLLVERSDVQALADAILQLLCNPDQRDAMALAAFERASTIFSWDRIAENLVKEYDRLFI